MALKQPQQAAVKAAYARSRGQAEMAAGETALIIQNKGAWVSWIGLVCGLSGLRGLGWVTDYTYVHPT